MKNLILTLSLSMLMVFVYAQSNDSISIALDLVDLSFRTSELDSMRTSVIDVKNKFKKIHEISIANNLSYSLVFFPPLNTQIIPDKQIDINWELEPNIKLPINKSDLAFYPVHQLSSLIKNKKITSVELTQFFIDRLRKYGDVLECVITITDSLALAQAKHADDELQKGIYRGPLHGIPYGAKDLLAVAEYKTTWGAMAYKDQQLDYTATVIKKLEKAGAVLVAKLTLG
ncbi:MAG: hypothetical protein KAJ28_02885, partial [Flavobacteriaceae bacterium]|nr:hypothetical protein [Flavobacteriaceae bacterium]